MGEKTTTETRRTQRLHREEFRLGHHQQDRSVNGLAGCFVHLFSEAEWAHIGPDLLDVSETFGLGATLSLIVPARCVLSVCRPDRILIFMIDDNSVDCFVFLFVSIHILSP